MGNRQGKKSVEAELTQKIDCFSKILQEHSTTVQGIIHSVEAQAAMVLMLSNKVRKIVSVKEIGANEKEIVGSEHITCCHCTTEWQEHANRLLGSIQSSLLFQSKSLNITFIRLNTWVNEIKKYYGIGDGTSVDKTNDRYTIDYKDSPTMDFGAEYQKLQSLVESIEKTKKDLKLVNAEYARQLEEMEEKNQKLIAEKEEQFRQMQDEKQRFEAYKNYMEEKSKEQEQKIKDMEGKLKSNEEIKKDMEEEFKDKETIMKEKIRCKEEKMHDMEKQSKGHEEKLKDIQNEIKGLREEKISLKQDIDDMKQTLTIQLFHNLKGGMVTTLLYELKTMIATQMQKERHEVQFVVCQTEADVNPRLPVFVFCINASRLGTDASSAIQNLKVSSKVSILVFHHKDVHALPSQASERVLTEPEFKELGGIFDVAFLTDKGIYECDMNRTSADGIGSFLRTQR